MIKVFYGERGSGKTKRMVDYANDYALSAKGNVVYLDRDVNRIHDLVHEIRLVNVYDFGIRDGASLISFIKGLLAGDSDIEMVYIDSAAKIISGGYEDMKKLFSEMENICREHGVDFGVTVEGKEEEKPDFILPYI